MRQKLPYAMIDGHLIAVPTLDDVWCVFAVPGGSYRAEPRTHQSQMVGALYKYCCEIKANFQILVVSSHWNTDRYTAQMSAHMPAAAHERHYLAFLEEQRDLLVGKKARGSRMFLSVRLAGGESNPAIEVNKVLSRSREDWKREWKNMRDRTRLQIAAQLNNTLYLPQHRERAKVALSRAKDHFPGVRPATPLEIQWLIRRSFSRGMAEPQLTAVPDRFATPYESQHTVAAWLRDYLVTPEHGYLRCLYEGGREGFQAGIVAGTIKDSEEFTRSSELMFTVLEQHDFPVDACLNVRWVANDHAQKKAFETYKQVAEEYLDESSGEIGAMQPGQKRVELTHDYHAELHETGDPQLRGTLSYLVSGESRPQLEDRVESFRHQFPHACHRPLIDQIDVFRSHFPAQKAHVRDYERIYTPTQVGAMVPHASHNTGSMKPGAWYYAKTLSGAQPLRIDLREASDSDDAPMTAILGTLGSGKTTLEQLLFYFAFLRGAYVVDIDPKEDHRWYLLPEVAPCRNVIEVGPEERYRGTMDPLRVALARERQEAATTFLTEVIGTEDEMLQAGIHGAVGRVIEAHGDRACCAEVVTALKVAERIEFRNAGEMLEQYMDAGLVRLGFARLEDPLISRAASQVTVIKTRVLQSLSSGERATQAQRHSRAVLRQVFYLGRKLLGEEPDTHKVFGFDETGEMARDALGDQFINQCSVWSRSDNLTPLIVTQDPQTVRGQRNRIGQWFVGKLRSREQIVELLEELELDCDGPLLKQIGNYHSGQFLHKDLNAFCEPIQVDPGPRLLAALNTRPTEERLAYTPSANGRIHELAV